MNNKEIDHCLEEATNALDEMVNERNHFEAIVGSLMVISILVSEVAKRLPEPKETPQ